MEECWFKEDVYDLMSNVQITSENIVCIKKKPKMLCSLCIH